MITHCCHQSMQRRSMMTKATSVLSIVLILTTTSVEAGCPHPSLLSPCTCDDNHIHCSHMSSIHELQRVVDKTVDYPFHSFSLTQSTLPYLKPEWFLQKRTRTFEVRNCTLISLFDRTPNNRTFPEMMHFTLYDTTLLRKMHLADVKPFVNLFSLTLIHAELKMGKLFRDMVSPKLNRVNIFESRITPFRDGMFDGKTKFKEMRIRGCGIKVLKNSFFKGAKNSLMAMDLRNPIMSLPEDLFSGFRNLVAFWLTNARLKTLPSTLFNGAKHISLVYLYDNPFVCNCKMRWITAKRPYQIYGSCASPITLENKPLDVLNYNDFDAC